MRGMRAPFETVEAARVAAGRFLPPAVASLLGGGNQAGLTMRTNTEVFGQVHLRSRACAARHKVSTAATILGRPAQLPLMIAPVAAQGLAPGAELGQARACAEAGIPLGVSNFASVSWRELVAQGAAVAAQLYWVEGREQMALRVESARRAGVAALILTVDWTFPAGRDWGTPGMPKAMGWRELLQWGPAALTKPAWSLPFLVKRALPPLKVPNFADREHPDPTFPEVMGRWNHTPYPRWEDVAWLRSRWDGPLLVKGILEPADALAAVEAGADGVVVSNHGGNDLDTVVPSLVALPAVAEAVGGRAQVLLDGGIRRGADVVKALALGADGVLIGRAAAWATAARGQRGVAEILDVFGRDIRQTLRALGVQAVGDLGPEHVVQGPEFAALCAAFARHDALAPIR